jgi:hypothetical protein
MSKKFIIISCILLLAIATAVYFLWYNKKPKFDIDKIIPTRSVTIPATSLDFSLNFDQVPTAGKDGQLVSNVLKFDVATGIIETQYLPTGVYPLVYVDSSGTTFQTDPSYVQVFPGSNKLTVNVLKAN